MESLSVTVKNGRLPNAFAEWRGMFSGKVASSGEDIAPVTYPSKIGFFPTLHSVISRPGY
jgi:hypothetical protein